MKKILTVQDISCLGKCSLTVALPIISAMGIEGVILPTAVLSTHTQFSRFTFRDLTGDIKPILDHWKEENIHFDALYTGYLGSPVQIDLMKNMFTCFGNGILKLVDPAMADNGKMYSGFDRSFARLMAGLCSMADVILPNLTEAAFMLGREYNENPSRQELLDIINELRANGSKSVVITGVSPMKGRLGVMGYDASEGRYFDYYVDEVPARYHGTGDVFSSVCCASLVKGMSLYESCRTAADFTALSIVKTLEDKNGNRYGVNFEEALPMLCR